MPIPSDQSIWTSSPKAELPTEKRQEKTTIMTEDSTKSVPCHRIIQSSYYQIDASNSLISNSSIQILIHHIHEHHEHTCPLVCEMIDLCMRSFTLLAVLWFLMVPVGKGGRGDEPCVTLTRAPEHTIHKGGHTRECFAQAVLSFESCRQLLFHSITCSSLSYMDKECSLHDKTKKSFEKSSIETSAPLSTIPIVYTKKHIDQPAFSSSEECSQYKFKPALFKFRECLSRAPPAKSSSAAVAHNAPLPLLGIVISVTSHWAHTHKAAIASITSNFECYSAAHNYIFVLNIMEDMPVEQFFHDRHFSVLHHHLHRFQFLLHLDADSLVLNISRSLDAFLQPSSPHVQLHMNENGEVTAATYLLRNSDYSRCFLQYWGNFSPPRISNNFLSEQKDSSNWSSLFSSTSTFMYTSNTPYDERLYEVPNYDNGDLVAAVMNMLGPNLYLTCMQVIASLPLRVTNRFTNSYHQTVVECWKLFHPTLHARVTKWSGNNLKIYLPKEGYWRTHSRRNRFGTSPTHWWNMLKASCFPSSDIIGHGWKGMMRKMWPMVSDADGNYDIQHVNSTRLCVTAVATLSSGGNTRCRWLDSAEELLMAQMYCSWRSPVCRPKKEMGKGGGDGSGEVTKTKTCSGDGSTDDGRSEGKELGLTEKKLSHRDWFSIKSNISCNL